VDIADSRLQPGGIATVDAGRTTPRQSLGIALDTVLGSVNCAQGIVCISVAH
jgi:hypothetical protein